jgi:hypothetical protein
MTESDDEEALALLEISHLQVERMPAELESKLRQGARTFHAAKQAARPQRSTRERRLLPPLHLSKIQQRPAVANDSGSKRLAWQPPQRLWLASLELLLTALTAQVTLLAKVRVRCLLLPLRSLPAPEC